MANNLGIPELTLNILADSISGANTVGPHGRATELTPIVVRVTDHADDVTAEEDDADKMALFYSRAHGHPWKKGSALQQKIHEVAPAGTDGAATATLDTGVVTAVTVDAGGEGYQNPTAEVQDPEGTGAELSVTVVEGVITAITVDAGGSGYTDPQVVIREVLDAVPTDVTIIVPNFDYSTFE